MGPVPSSFFRALQQRHDSILFVLLRSTGQSIAGRFGSCEAHTPTLDEHELPDEDDHPRIRRIRGLQCNADDKDGVFEAGKFECPGCGLGETREVTLLPIGGYKHKTGGRVHGVSVKESAIERETQRRR